MKRLFDLLTVLCLLAGLSPMGLSGAQVIINELMYHPSSENNLEEFIELFNQDTNAVHLTGWQFTAGIFYTFTNDVVVAPGGYLVIAADLPTFQKKYPGITNVVGGWRGILSNSGQ